MERESRSRVHRPLDSGDTPSFPGCWEAAAAVAGGGLAAWRTISERPGTHVLHAAGGLHHAHPGRASGFCIFNDPALVIRSALPPLGPLRRVAYLDVDVHHGDGVMYGFYDRGSLLDIDFHQDGRTIFPGTGSVAETGSGDGAGLKVNVPLPPSAGNEALLPLFERIVPTLLRSYRPELIVLQCGVDGHVDDRLGQLQYTPEAYRRVVALVHALAHEVASGRLLVTGGGGYTAENVSRVLARAGTLLVGAPGTGEADAPLPAGWREEFRSAVGYEAPRTWEEHPEPDRSTWTPDRADRLLAELGERLGVRWGARGVSPPAEPPGRG